MTAENLPAVYASLLGYDCTPRSEKPACVCTVLHYQCDPRLCPQAYTLSSTNRSYVSEPRWPVEFTFNVLAENSFRCQTCAIFHGGLTLPEIRSKWDTALNMNERTKYDYYERCTVKILDSHGNVDIEDGSYTQHSFVFKVQDLACLTSGCKVFSVASALNESTGSYLSFQTLRAWIKECVNHPACPTMQPLELPKRVIDVFHDPKTSNVRLHTTNGEKDFYITLSHCWGHKMPMKTTKANLPEMSRLIEWKTMPQTFLDAVNIARNLRVRYLWIDALCIVQDDAKDWEVESAKMKAIYQQSLLTVAASHAKDSRGGCFHPITAGSGRLRNIPSPISSSRPSGISISEVSDRHDVCRETKSAVEVGSRHEPLLNRGWVLQERLLSPRVAHYTNREIIWECAQAVRCQCNRARLNTNNNLRMKLYRTTPDEGTIATTSLWLHLVEEFSRRQLTFDADRLPALSGLAKFFLTKGFRTYLAGLWLEDLALSTIWNQTQIKPKLNRMNSVTSVASSRKSRFSMIKDTSCISPSWSWVSVDGPISFLYSKMPESGFEHRSRISIVSAECKPATLDPTGRVRSGSLKLTGLVLKIYELIPPDSPSGPAGLRRRRGDAVNYFQPDSREILNGGRTCCILWTEPAKENGDAYFMIVWESKNFRSCFERIGMSKMAWKVKQAGAFEYTAEQWFGEAEWQTITLV